MDLTWTTAQQNFREEVRTWLEENVPTDPRPHDLTEAAKFDKAWQQRQYEGGWAGVSWPTEYGGLGLDVQEQMIWHEEYARADAPYVGMNFVGLNHAGPTLILKANEAQKREHLQQILRGEVLWCQGFSEPEAGSDLASLQTRAEIDGDHLVVNGTKIWTSYADQCDYQELLVRTDPSAPKHKGITWVINDMRQPGIDIRPIETILGEHHFCEVFYDDVRIPIDSVVGEVNDGWAVAMATLSFERGSAFMAEQVELAKRVEELIDAAGSLPAPDGRRRAIEDDEIGRNIAQVRAEVTALRAMTYASVSRAMREDKPGPEGSMVRLYYTLVWQRLYRVALQVTGVGSVATARDTPDGQWSWHYLNSLRSTIAAGTKDIQRNIIGERLLGLPRGR